MFLGNLANCATINNDSYSYLNSWPWGGELNFRLETVKVMINRLSNTLAWFPYIWISLICFLGGVRRILWELTAIPLNYFISEESLFHLLRLGISGI